MRYYFMCFPQGKRKAVTLSYDDGVIEDLRLAQILNEHGMKATFNINSFRFQEQPGERFLTPEQIRQYILDAGHEVAIHGHRHGAPGLLRPVDAIRDILECRMALENEFDRIIRGMAYPDSGITRMQNGADYDTIKRYLQDLGVVYARSLKGDNDSFQMPEDWHNWVPTAHHNNPKVLEYAEKFLVQEFKGAKRYPRLFYLWGHSYEFARDDNWEHMQQLCQILGGRQDTWYATNMEIYEYAKAYGNLVFTADGRKVYNPNRVPVWMDFDKTVYCIEPGCTVTLE